MKKQRFHCGKSVLSKYNNHWTRKKKKKKKKVNPTIITVRNGISDLRGCPHRVMVKARDCGIVIREFVLQLRYYVHFRANTLGKGMNPLILPAMG